MKALSPVSKTINYTHKKKNCKKSNHNHNHNHNHNGKNHNHTLIRNGSQPSTYNKV